MTIIKGAQLYINKQQELLKKHEDACLKCGACCGIKDGDPCINLQAAEDGKYYCSVYTERLGSQKTLSGKDFTCVPIREVLKFDAPHRKCGYIVNDRK